GRVARGDEQAGLAVDDGLADAAYRRRDHGHARRLRLDHGQAEALEERREREYVERREQLRHVVARAGELDRQAGGAAFALLAQLAVADDDDADAFREEACRLEERRVVLLRREAGDVADDRAVLVQRRLRGGEA